MSLTAYRSPRHRAGCVALFDGHLGTSFRPEERGDFIAFLDSLPGPYLVLTEGVEILACGGIAFEDDGRTLASVCWTIVHPEHQGRGLGRRLLEGCLEVARREPACAAVRLETAPETVGFFQGLGFTVEDHQADGYGPGLPRVEMRRTLEERAPA